MANLKDTLPNQTASSLDDELKLKQLQLLDAQIADIEAAKEFRKSQEWEINLKREQEKERIIAADMEKDKRRRVGESMAKDSLSTTANERINQRRCSHLNMRGEPDTATVRDYSNKIIMVCQGCQKSWHENDLGDNFPYNLIHPTRYMGSFGSQ